MTKRILIGATVVAFGSLAYLYAHFFEPMQSRRQTIVTKAEPFSSATMPPKSPKLISAPNAKRETSNDPPVDFPPSAIPTFLPQTRQDQNAPETSVPKALSKVHGSGGPANWTPDKRIVSISPPASDQGSPLVPDASGNLVLELPHGMRLPAVLTDGGKTSLMSEAQARVAEEVADTFANAMIKAVNETDDQLVIAAAWEEATMKADQRFAGFFGEREWIRRSIIAGREALAAKAAESQSDDESPP